MNSSGHHKLGTSATPRLRVNPYLPLYAVPGMVARRRKSARRAGVQAGTIDALLAQLCIRHDLTLLTADRDFTHIAQHCPLRLWRG